MGREQPVYVWCVVKSAMLRKKDGSLVFTIPFGSRFRVLSDMGDGKYYGETYKRYGQGYTKYRGYVSAAGFVNEEVIDMAYLRFKNITGQRIPVTMRFKGKADGWINPDEVIHVIAYTNGWMLTGKGWTKAEWLRKERGIEDYESMKTVVYAVITQAVKDYSAIVRKMQSGIRWKLKDFPDAITELRLIRKWFHDGDYLKIIEDSMTGDERLQCLDRELGVTDEWLRQMLSKKKA